MFFDKRFKSTLLTSVSIGAVIIGTNALANPEGANVVTGDVAINGIGTDHVIIQNDSNRSIVNWDTFSIGAGETTTINQISSEAAILNRVVTNNVSEIYGTLRSNGKVFLVNQSGIVIGASGIVDTNGLVASTLDVSNTDFLGGGDMIFKQSIENGGGIEVHGKIRSISGGDIFLLSREITIGSTAEISSEGGYVGVGAGEEILLRPSDTGDGRISIRAGKGKIVNQGTIEAVAAELKAAGGNEYALAINNTGVVRATGYSKSGGKIRLGGGGKVRNTGKLVARKKVIVRSKKKIENSGQIKAGDGNNGGEIIFEAPEIEVQADSILDVAGALGGGRIFVGGGYQGTGADHDGNEVDITDNAIKVTVDDGAVLTASATQSGDAGEIVVWADGETVFAGDIVATAAQGHGGDVEVSGKQTLNIAGITANLRGSEGNGTLLLDPDDITITADDATGANQVLDSDIQSLLGATNVVISTGKSGATPPDDSGSVTPDDDPAVAGGTSDYSNGGGTNGDVTFEAGVSIRWTDAGADTGTTFTVHAARDIIAADKVIIQHSETGTGAVGNIVDGGGGITFLAGNNIQIGSDGTARTGGVAIGSEFGSTTMVAGDSDFNGIVDKAGNVLVIGGKGPAGQTNQSAQIGYVSLVNRANNPNFDHADATTDFRAVNGDILVVAGRHVSVTGGVGNISFAQIGHGGYADAQVGGTITTASQIVDSNINVTSGLLANDPGDVTLMGGDNNLAFAKIGHGAVFRNNSQTNTQRNISGNVTVKAQNGGSIKLNDMFTATTAAPDKFHEVRAQIGHGATFLIEDAANSTGNARVSHGKISGNITLDADASFIVGADITAVAGDNRYAVTSQVGHGGYAEMSAENAGDVILRVTFDRITEFTDLDEDDDDETTDISVTAADITVRAREKTQNSAANANDRKVDNLQRSIIGHGGTVNVDESGKAAATSTGTVNVIIDHSYIAGDITLTDDSQVAKKGITVEARITGTNIATNNDVMIARVGHATLENIHTRDGAEQAAANGGDGGSVRIGQAHILGSRIRVSTGGNEDRNEDISLVTNITAGDAVVEDSTAVAQIGHSADTFVKTGKGGDGADANAGATYHSGNAGDIRIFKGTVSDGLRHYTLNTLNDGTTIGTYGDNGGLLDDDFNSSDDGNTDIIVLSSNQIKIDSDTAAATAGANRNNAESSIGHGHKQRLMTGDGGTNAKPDAGNGGRGGDIQINQVSVGRDFGDDSNTENDLTVSGLRGEIVLGATHKTNTPDDLAALSITSDDASSAMAATNNNSGVSTVGHGDFIEMTTGKGGDGGTTANVETDQKESFGGRGGHIDVNLAGMTIQSDIQLTKANAESIGGITGAIEIKSKSSNADKASNRALVESVIGHSERIFGHTGDGGTGGTAEYLANANPVVANAAAQDAFQQNLIIATPPSGASRGGNGGDISIEFGGINDRSGQAFPFTAGLTNAGEADIHVVVKDHNDTANSLIIQAEVGTGNPEGNGADVFAGIGHHTRLYGEGGKGGKGGKGGDGGETRTQLDEDPQDTNYSIQPDASGGRGGDVRLSSGNIVGDVVVDVTRQAVVDSIAGHGTFTKVIAGIGHTTDLVAVTQNGGKGGDLNEVGTGTIGTDIDGGIDAISHGNMTVTEITFVDRNDDFKFDLTGVNDSDSTVGEDGIDIDFGSGADGVAETFTSLGDALGFATEGAVSATGGVIFHDQQGDPQYILNGSNVLVINDASNATLRNAGNNIARFGRTVGAYDADVTDPANQPRFVDIDQDGDVDFVDFDADGRIDIVDIDRDGVYDEIDGRSSPRVAGFGILDYAAVTGVDYSQSHLQGGWELADFSTSNGGRGGDAQTSVGMTMGHVAVDVGNPTKDVADSLIVRSTVTDATAATGGPRDVSIARIGHGAFQMSDTGGSYAKRAAGRTEVDMDGTTITQGHSAADGGDAGNFAINGNGGRGGDASVTQGASRDIDPGTNASEITLETDHLVGNIYVNTLDASLPSDLRLSRTNQSDSKRISVLATADNDAGTNISVAQIGHGSQAAATAGAWTGNHGALVGAEGNTGGKGASKGDATAANDTSSQTELADGGRGGDASLTQNQIKGTIDVRTGADDSAGGGDKDFSIEVKATKGPATAAGGDNNIITAQIGHGRNGIATGGNGGDGDDGQLSGNGGRGGDVTATQTAIIDTAITIDLVDSIGTTNGYYGNGLWIDSTTQLGSQQIVRGQVGHGDLVFAEGGAGGNGSAGGKSDVVEQRNQTVNGGRGGDATINQNGYNYDITLDLGPNGEGPDEALKVISHVDTTNVGTKNHTFAAVGHGGYAEAIANKGGDGADRNGMRGIESSNDPNQRDGVDSANRITLGTDRSGGRGGNAVSNIGVNGTGRAFSAATGNDRSGLIVVDSIHNTQATTNDVAKVLNSDGADINITLYDDLSGVGAAARDGVLVEAKTGKGDTQTRAIDTTTAIIGHTGYNRVDATAATGGNAIDTVDGATISEGDGGDGGSATATTGSVLGSISVDNTIGAAGVNTVTGSNATDIIVRAVDQADTDGEKHRADARIGHMVSAEALSGAGGNAAKVDSPNIYPATISSQGGDGGDALTYQGQQEGNITLTAENSVIVSAKDTTAGQGALIAGVGHRVFAEAEAADGGEGGKYNGDDAANAQSIYFTYEALREFHYRRLTETDEAAFNALPEFEQKLVAPVTDYFENKQGELEIFLDRLVGDNGNVILHNERDNDTATTAIPALVDGNGHIKSADDGEIETLSAILAASGHGGNAVVTQGSDGLSGHSDKLAASGNIKITANAFNTTDTNTDRGIIVEGVAGSDTKSFELGHVGHQSEAKEVKAGNGSDLPGTPSGANGIGGDGGDAVVDQYALNGGIDLVSNHKIKISAADGGAADHETRAWVGHRLTVGSDFTSYRTGNASVTAGNGGNEKADSGQDDGHNGNGGDVFIYQRGVISGTARTVSTGTTDVTYDTEISLAALQDTKDDANSITIEALATGATAKDVETHIGHDFLIHGVKAGDAGRPGGDTGPQGASEGLLEGNGGDIFIAQTDLGADIDIVGRDTINIFANATTSAGNHAHLMIGHERTIGNSAELDDTLDGGIKDNPRLGTIVAGFGGDAYTEDVNGTAMASRDAAKLGIIEDADSGRIEIALGKITDSADGDNDTRLVTIISLTEDVDVLSDAALGSAVLEIGNQQQVIAVTKSASEFTGDPKTQTAGDAGGIYITRDTIDGDILIQAIDADRANSSKLLEGKQVVIDSKSATPGKAITQIGHETQFTALSSDPTGVGGTVRAAFGEDRNFLFADGGKLDTFQKLAGTATLGDAQNAVEDMRDLVRALKLANENADRYTSAEQTELSGLITSANDALSAAVISLNSVGTASGTGTISEASAVGGVVTQAQELIAAATGFQNILSNGSVPNAGDQIADFAEGGDIVYGQNLTLTGDNPLNSHTDSIDGVDGLDYVSDLSIQHAPSLKADNLGGTEPNTFEVDDTGTVSGDVDVLSGRYSGISSITDLTSLSQIMGIGIDAIVADTFSAANSMKTGDDLDDSVVMITADADGRSLTELGHRRIMENETSFGGGDSNGDDHEGGVAGDAGSIITSNTTTGDISVQAEEIIITTKGASGEGEVHLLHSSHTTNIAGWSDIKALLGNGGDIYNTTIVSGGVTINAEWIASSLDGKDRKLLATGSSANTLIHMGHQAEDKNESKSDPQDPTSLGDDQTNLGSNRGGKVVSSQSVTGNSNGDLVIITLDAAGDAKAASDLIIETAGIGGSDIRLGNGEDGGMMGILHNGTSGINNDDGSTVTLTQNVAGDIKINTIEDLHINNVGAGGDENIYIGHDAEQHGQSGEVNAVDGVAQYGERVTVTQTITGNVNVETTSSYTATLAAAKAGEIHVGHEGTQSAFSADDSANPSDLEDVNNDGIADNGTNSGEGPSATGVNDNFNQPDVLATQTIEAGISIVTGEITLENLGTKNQIHYGHEATHKAAVDGDLKDNFNGTNPSVTGTSVKEGSTGHVVASSKINAGGSDIYFEAKGSTVQNDTVLAPIHGTQGDIQLDAKDIGKIHVGHSSTSTMGDTKSDLAEGQFNAEQIIGTSTLDADGNEVTDTSQSVIEFRAVQDIIVASVDGETQVGHFIVEKGNETHDADKLNVDGNATTGLAEGDSELRQVVGSDIIFGDKSNQGSGGVGTKGAGNDVVIETGAGRTIIGHQSPGSNEWQVEGTRSVTVQLLDGDITIEAGTDEGLDAPNGTVIASATLAIADKSGAGDDLLLKSGAMGTARIGHNMAGVDDTDPDSVANETQRSAGDIWVRAGGDMHILGGAIGHENYDFGSITPTNKNATPESLASGTPIRDRIRGNTTIAAGQNSAPEDSTTIANILKIDGKDKAVEINSGYGGQGGKDVAGQLRFFLPAQEGLTVALGKGVTFNDSKSNGDAVPARSSSKENIFENEGGNDHEHPFAFASASAAYTNEFIGAGNFTFYFEPAPVVPTTTTLPIRSLPQFTPFLYRGSNDSGFGVTYLNDDGTSAGGALNTDGLSEEYIGTSSYEAACDEKSQSGAGTQEGSVSGECSTLEEKHDGIEPGFGSNTEWSGQAGGNASVIVPYLDEDDELGENAQVVGFTVYQEPVITTQQFAVERSSRSYFNVKTITRKLPKYDGRVITQTIPSSNNPTNSFSRTVTNSSPLEFLKTPATITTQGNGVNSFDVSNNAVFSTTTHQFFTGYDAGNDYQVTAVDNEIGTYVDDTGIDAYMAQHAGAMSFASSYQVFEEKLVE